MKIKYKMAQISIKTHYRGPKIKSVILVGQKSIIYYIQMVVVALLSVYLIESVDLVSVDLVVNCTSISTKHRTFFRTVVNTVDLHSLSD